MKKRTLAFLLVFALVALCGCGEEQPAQNQGKTSRAAANELVVGISQDLGSSLDPYEMTAAGTREIMFNVYEGLYKPTSDGDYVPALAEDCILSEDGLGYTFILREGVQFHNGDVMDADDVVYSFNTCKETSVDSSLAPALANVVDVAAAADGKSVSVTLAAPNSDFITCVASVFIVPADYTEQATAPVGTGPYCFVSRSVQENVILQKFDAYWGEHAKIDTVTCKIYEDSTALITALEGGAVDLAAHLSVEQVSGLNNGYDIVEGTMNLVQALYLNNAAAPFDNVLVRQALCYAVDVDELLALTADGHGTKVGSSMYPAFGKYFDDSLTDYYSYDPDKAKELLAEAGYADGFTMTITVPSNYTPHVNAAQVLVQQLAAVGITAELQEVEWNTWLTDVYQGRDFMSTVIGFDASMLTANAMLQRWTSDSSKNMINFSNAEYDALIAEADSSMDDAARTELYLQAERILTEQAANVYLQDMAEMLVINPAVKGYEFYPLYVMDFSLLYYGE